MIDLFEYIIHRLFEPDRERGSFSIFNPSSQFNEKAHTHADIVKALNAAFMIILSGKRHKDSDRAEDFIKRMAKSSGWADLAGFYLSAKRMINEEIETVCTQYPNFADSLRELHEWLSEPGNENRAGETIEKIWSVFFPEGTGIYEAQEEKITQLRAKRTVRISRQDTFPITDPGRQLLFTSNVLLSVPDESTTPEELALTADLKHRIFQAAREPQSYWYDHPIRIGVKPEQNEVFYGLRGLSEAVEFERTRGNMTGDKITCVLSVSVTHRGLQRLARRYLEVEVSQFQDIKNINVYVFTEADTESIVEDILVPAAAHYMGKDNAAQLLGMFGVDGEYGRHYSFLKAISAFWNVLIDPEIKATFKIDLDQIFTQKELVEQTKASAFEHFKSPLWGARGVDSEGSPVELGMIAGALVNERDIGKGLFTPDVVFPDRNLSPEDRIFFSALPQALSTEAEMMTRYGSDTLDGIKTCIQRIHVTGGTNGILVESLRRHRPFTPSFMGRAEDQAYILSVFPNPGDKLAYVHEDGLIMRHDKEAFAQEAIKVASLGKLVGDYVRTLFFSGYARVLGNDISSLKRSVDPFTGCFISLIPTTVVCLRFCLRAASFFAAGKNEKGLEFITIGTPRIQTSLSFVSGQNSLLRQTYERERLGWDLYYDVLSAMEDGLKTGDHFALELRKKAKGIVKQCLITDGADNGRQKG